MIDTYTPMRDNPIAGNVKKSDYYELELESKSDDALRIIGGGKEHCEAGCTQSVVQSRYFGIEYIVSGSGVLERNGIAEPLAAGSLFGYGPESTFVLRASAEQPLVKHFIHFEGTEAQSITENKLLVNAQTPNLSHHKWVERAFVSMQECGTGAYEKRQAACKHLLFYLAARLGAISRSELDTANVSASRANFDNICRYIEENCTCISSPQEIAQAFSISHQYLCFLFKRFSDETPTKMVTRFKLARAMELLRDRSLLIKQVAVQVGFVDQYYFSKCFKGRYGLSPRKFLNRSAIKATPTNLPCN